MLHIHKSINNTTSPSLLQLLTKKTPIIGRRHNQQILPREFIEKINKYVSFILLLLLSLLLLSLYYLSVHFLITFFQCSHILSVLMSQYSYFVRLSMYSFFILFTCFKDRPKETYPMLKIVNPYMKSKIEMVV